jgi:hypothetical protein
MKASIYSIILFFLFPLFTLAQTNKTKVLVLGTAHLSQIEGFESSMLNPIIKTLNTRKFDVVCIEKMPGQLLYDIKSRNDKAFDGVIKGGWGKAYLMIADTVQKTQKLSHNEAAANIGRLLKKPNLSDKDRKLLFYSLLATTDIPSAVLQYQYLKGKKDLFVNDFDKFLQETIEKKSNSPNEFYTLALPLAFLGKQNIIEAIDNFQDEALLLKYYPNFISDLQSKAEELSMVSKLPVYQKTASLTEEGIKEKDLSKLYSFLNSEEYMKADYDAQWKIWLKTNLDSGSDRARLSLWEMRNLQITANILDVASRHPGQRIIVIIGSSHKGFLQKYLQQIEDIELLEYR